MRLVWVAVLLAVWVGPTQQTQVTIPCCDLWFTLNHYIQTHAGVDRSACEPLQCVGTGQVESFMTETNAVLTHKLHFEGSNIVMDMTNTTAMQNILVWSYLGRHFTSTRQRKVMDDFYFEFNIATRTMVLRKVQCEFQKHVYESMIVLTVVVLIFILSSRMMRTVVDEYRQKHAGAIPVAAVSVIVNGSAPALAMRYRPIPQ